MEASCSWQEPIRSPKPIAWPGRSWFKKAFGFPEDEDYTETQQKLMLLQQRFSHPSNTDGTDVPVLNFGQFSCPTVKELREDCNKLLQELCKQNISTPPGCTIWRNMSASVLDLHVEPSNVDATFQAASQFNCLEFVSPSCTPEQGITDYCRDRTQGPACAIACGAGTAYRNYLVEWPKNSESIASVPVMGQTEMRQINNLDLVLDKLQINGIRVVNGYADGNNESLTAASTRLQVNRDDWIDSIKVGVQRDTEVTYPRPTGRTVTQVYCSAVPVSYTSCSVNAWRSLAEVALAGAYEATLLVAIRNVMQALLDGDLEKADRCKCVYLTFVGGGVFGNEMEWIYQAMRRANERVSTLPIPLDVVLVHFGSVDMDSIQLVKELSTPIV